MPVKKFFAWSFSRLSDYRKCPALAKYKHLDRLPEPPSPAMARGNDVHVALAAYLRGLRSMPTEARQISKFVQGVRRAKPLVELRSALDRKWKEVDWRSPSAWLRVVVDALTIARERGRDTDVATPVDWKTGKVRDGYDEQLELYAASTFALRPNVARATTVLAYVDAGEIRSAEFRLADAAGLRKKFEDLARPMLADAKFAPRPGNYCAWCAFSKAKGGPCPY